MKRYIISDLHFGHESIIKFCSRPFDSVEEMNEILIENWNKVVKSSDRVYLVGDVAWKKKDIPLCEKLNGKKILIKGNHDVYPLEEYTKYFEDIRSYLVEDNMIVSHIPIYLNEHDRFIGNIHGHTHEKNMSNYRYLNISVEQISYTPVLIEEVKENLFNKCYQNLKL